MVDYTVCKWFESFFFYRCGLEAGDIITHVNGIPVQKPAELYSFQSRNFLEIGVINKGKSKTVILKMA